LAQCLLAARSRGPLIPGWVAMKDRTPTGQRFMAANAASVQRWRMSQPREISRVRKREWCPEKWPSMFLLGSLQRDDREHLPETEHTNAL
jgi:hypothetical protein